MMVAQAGNKGPWSKVGSVWQPKGASGRKQRKPPDRKIILHMGVLLTSQHTPAYAFLSFRFVIRVTLAWGNEVRDKRGIYNEEYRMLQMLHM